METSTDSVLSRRDPAWRFYRETVDRFGGDEIVVLVLRGRKPFDPEVLGEIQRLTRELEKMDGVRRVDSLASFPIVRMTPDVALGFAVLGFSEFSPTRRGLGLLAAIAMVLRLLANVLRRPALLVEKRSREAEHGEDGAAPASVRRRASAQRLIRATGDYRRRRDPSTA